LGFSGSKSKQLLDMIKDELNGHRGLN